MGLLTTFARIADITELTHSRLIDPAALQALHNLKARETLRPYRQEAALRGVETRKRGN